MELTHFVFDETLVDRIDPISTPGKCTIYYKDGSSETFDYQQDKKLDLETRVKGSKKYKDKLASKK